MGHGIKIKHYGAHADRLLLSNARFPLYLLVRDLVVVYGSRQVYCCGFNLLYNQVHLTIFSMLCQEFKKCLVSELCQLFQMHKFYTI